MFQFLFIYLLSQDIKIFATELEFFKMLVMEMFFLNFFNLGKNELFFFFTFFFKHTWNYI